MRLRVFDTHDPLAPEPLVVDSYRVSDGRVVGLTRHERRFFDQVPGIPAGFFQFIRSHLPMRGEWFPRVEWYGGTDFGLWLRPSPERRESTSLWLSDLVDPRTQPTVKGPDLRVLGHLRSLALDYRCDDTLLVSLDGAVLEATNTAVVFWDDDGTVVIPGGERLVSISVAVTVPHWEAAGILVTERRVTRLDLPAWCGNSLHGWTPVTHWGRGAGKITAAPAPSVKRWNKALWDQAETI